MEEMKDGGLPPWFRQGLPSALNWKKRAACARVARGSCCVVRAVFMVAVMKRWSWHGWWSMVFASVFAALGSGCSSAGKSVGGREVGEYTYDRGGIVRGARGEKSLALVFTGGEYGEGSGVILDALAARGGKASFFVTGDYLRQEAHRVYLRRMVDEGHYLGPHSDGHPLYCAWEDRTHTLMTREAFREDLGRNLDDLSWLGLTRERMRFFIPPYEWYNAEIVVWAREMGLTLINFTPGTRSHADWAPEGHRSFLPSRAIYDGILNFEAAEPDGLCGFLLLMHLGAGPERGDKMHDFIGPLIDELGRRGYRFVRVDELLPQAMVAETPGGEAARRR